MTRGHPTPIHTKKKHLKSSIFHFSTHVLWTDGLMDGQMDGQVDGQMDGRSCMSVTKKSINRTNALAFLFWIYSPLGTCMDNCCTQSYCQHIDKFHSLAPMIHMVFLSLYSYHPSTHNYFPVTKRRKKRVVLYNKMISEKSQ